MDWPQILCLYCLASAMLEKIDLDWSQRLCSSIGDRCACRLATDWPHCATKIVLVFFGKCLAREDCSGLATKIVLVDWRQRLWSSATKIRSSIGDRWARRLATDWPHCARRLATDALVDWRRITHKDCATDALVDWRRIRHKDCVRNFWQLLCSRRLFWMCSSIGDKDCGRQVLFSSYYTRTLRGVSRFANGYDWRQKRFFLIS